MGTGLKGYCCISMSNLQMGDNYTVTHISCDTKVGTCPVSEAL